MPRSAPVLLALGALLVGCSAPIDVGVLRFHCARDAECSDGFRCVASECAPDSRPTACAGGCPGGVCDASSDRCRYDCEPACPFGLTCDLQRNRCVYAGGSCVRSAPAMTASGFVGDFVDEAQGGGQVPSDVVLAGSAVCAAEGLVLTSAPDQAGAVWFGAEVELDRFVASAEVRIRATDPPLEQADGFGLVWGEGTPGQLGRAGAYLGFGGLSGYAVELDTFQGLLDGCTEPVEPPAPHVALRRLGPESAYLACGPETFAVAPLPEAALAGGRLQVELGSVGAGRARVQVRYQGQLVLEQELDYTLTRGVFGLTAGTGSKASVQSAQRLELSR